MKRRYHFFTLMLAAFIVVIVLSVCGMGSVFFLATRVGETTSGQAFAPPWLSAVPTTVTIGPSKTEDAGSTDTTVATNPYAAFRQSFDWRGPLSAFLALSAVLIGASTFFSSRVTRPLTRFTRAARTMAAGDLNVRVDNSAVREIDDLAGAFNSMASSLSEADRQRRQMTADVAHELRTPLSIIRGRLEGIQDGIYKATPDEIATLLNETALLERLIEDLRLLALADAGQLPLHLESIEPVSMLRSVAQSFAQQAYSQGVEIVVSVLPSLPEVQADPQRILQVLGNLTANSLRHTPAGGRIVLSATSGGAGVSPDSPISSGLLMTDIRRSRSGAQTLPLSDDASTVAGYPSPVVFSVSDTGSGIAPSELPHIFDRFYRADQSRTRSSGGAGLGLAIAKRLIEAHHGTIWASSTPGQGTTVSFSLPAMLGA